MDEPARKKRRTLSPRERDRSSSPLKKPPRRPSFASPTKASLARFNPDLIPSVLRKQSGSALGRGKQGRASIFNLQSGHIPGSQPAHGKDIQAKEGAAQATSLGYREPAASSNRTQAAEGREQELELPTSSSPRAMEYGSPRRGTLFSSPTKRPPRKAVHVRSKPAKSRQDGEQRTTAREDQTDHTALKWEAPNPELERKKREKEKLLRELEELEKDISQSVDWIRTLQRGTHARLSRQEQDKIM